MTRPTRPTRPSLETTPATLARLYSAALSNLLDINTVPKPTGDGEFIRAGGGYPQPWTRDAAINCWNAASLLSPDIARATLLSTTEPAPAGSGAAPGTRVIAQDNEWWDQIIWVIGAWSHYVITGDEEFLAVAHQTGVESLKLLEHLFNADFGLYRGGAVMQDGIAGYPQPPFDPTVESASVLAHPLTHQMMSLSTNAVYTQAFRCLGRMAALLGHEDDEKAFAVQADALAEAINTHLWIEDRGHYGYFLDGSGAVDPHQEALGHAFVLLFDVADAERAAKVLATQHRQPFGVVSVWPHFERFDAEHPGRHNAISWPMIMGFWGVGAAHRGGRGLMLAELHALCRLVAGSADEFFEIYNSDTGEVEGGWQNGVHWASEPDQTWSATAYLRLVHEGVLGLNFTPEGIRLAPALPEGTSSVTVRDLAYREATLDIVVRGTGAALTFLTLDGAPVDLDAEVHLPATLTGAHTVLAVLGK